MSNDGPLTNTHRFFTQFMITNGTVPLDKALTFLEEISPEQEQNYSTRLKTLIIEINREICNQFFKIATTTCEVTGEEALVWLNMKNDDLSKLQVAFSVTELEYFHFLMKEIISEHHRIQYPRAINISSTLNGTLSRENGEKALTRWIHGGYFVKRDRFVYLGPRLILEFASYLRTNTENCICNLCAELVFVGIVCGSCHKNFHTVCIEKYLQNNNTCPSCKSEWAGEASFATLDDTEP